MLLFRAAAVTFVGVLVSATPVPGSQSEMPATEFVPLRAPNLNYEWHKPTAQDLQVMASNGTYLSDAEGHPISGDTKRQFGPGSYRTNTFLSGDGDSHQNPFQQQVTQTFRCGADSCSVGQSAPHSLSWQTDGDRGLGWILGDFNVQEKYETDGTTSCDAGPGEEVCIWFSYEVTAYTVTSTQCYYYNGISHECRDLGTRILFSPNKCQRGEPYCVRGSACRSDNDGYWSLDNASVGGPPC